MAQRRQSGWGELLLLAQESSPHPARFARDPPPPGEGEACALTGLTVRPPTRLTRERALPRVEPQFVEQRRPIGVVVDLPNAIQNLLQPRRREFPSGEATEFLDHLRVAH